MTDLKILIITHKECQLPKDESFLPIQVGRILSDTKLNIQGDDNNENISEKNPNYCELTGLFWAWKNLKDTEFVGLNHYRRYFCRSNKYQHSIYLTEKEFAKIDVLNLIPNYKNILKKHDIIKVRPFTYYHSVEAVLSNILSTDDLKILEFLIKEKYPEYYNIYIDYMRYNNKISSCNMFISNFSVFEEYSKWLFELLFELEKRVRISPYNTPARIFGFISEALFNIYCIKKKFKIKYLPIYVIRDDVQKDNHLIYTLKNIRRNISFFFNKPKR